MQVRHRSVHWIALGSLVVSSQSFCSLIEFFRCSQDGLKGPSCFLAVYFANMLTLRNSPEITSVGPVPTGRHREQWPVETGPTLHADWEVNSRQFPRYHRVYIHSGAFSMAHSTSSIRSRQSEFRVLVGGSPRRAAISFCTARAFAGPST